LCHGQKSPLGIVNFQYLLQNGDRLVGQVAGNTVAVKKKPGKINPAMVSESFFCCLQVGLTLHFPLF